MADNSNYYSTQKSLYFTGIKSFRQKSVMVIMELPWRSKALLPSSTGQTLSYIIPMGHKVSISNPEMSRRRKDSYFLSLF